MSGVNPQRQEDRDYLLTSFAAGLEYYLEEPLRKVSQ
jgi:hypothetical protein